MAGQISGAVFTTDINGTRTNANVYENKADVFLDGGPGPNAPSGAAGLPEGDYYFQVTDPSGKRLLSTDPVANRKFHVNAYGVIDGVYTATSLQKIRGQLVEVDATHQTGVDVDHQELGAITIQLIPFDITPNKGRVYKVWVTPVDRFVGDPSLVDNPSYFHGFVPAWSKTDNFKIKNGGGGDPITIRKFDDSNANGVWDAGELEVTGWPIEITDPLGTTNNVYTPAEVVPSAGSWQVSEGSVNGWLQTALIVDGQAVPVQSSVTVQVTGVPGEKHEVAFGNIRLGSVIGWKFYDRNLNGLWDSGEPPVQGFKISLSGTDVRGSWITLEEYTDSTGQVVFDGLLPGAYVAQETVPQTGGWFNTSPTSVNVNLVEGGEESAYFGNAAAGTADFGTKGYWHNPNGIAEVTPPDIDYVNGLAPYSESNEYWNEAPFDGTWTPRNPGGYFGEGAWAEISDYLVSPVNDSPARFQLSQQLLAFIFNVRHRVTADSMIQLSDGTWVNAGTLIGQAIATWQGGSVEQQVQMSGTIESLNSSDNVQYLLYNPPSVVY
ncbi:MAG: SdrD B-like domain-containing protein [Candidatus Aquicultorales bacterium]